MSVFVPAKDSVLRAINAANSASYTLNDIVLSTPKPVAGTWREGTTSHNSFLKISANPAGGLDGSSYYTFDRLNLGDFNYFKPSRPLPAYGVNTTKDLLRNILYYFGLNIQDDDILDEPVSLTNGAGTVTINANPNSYGWLGSLSFEVSPGGADLAGLITTKALNGLNYPVEDPNSISALMYMYPYDFTASRDALLALTQGSALTQGQADALVTMIKAKDTGSGAALWNSDAGQNTWSLAGATVFFNGLNNSGLPTNSKYKYAVGLELRAGVTAPVGRFYLQFSDPEDPNSAE